jgi:hypothetical protein
MAALAPSPADSATWLKLASEWLAMARQPGRASAERLAGERLRRTLLVPAPARGRPAASAGIDHARERSRSAESAP